MPIPDFSVRTRTLTVGGMDYEIRRFGGRAEDALADNVDKPQRYQAAIIVAHGLAGNPSVDEIERIYDDMPPSELLELAHEVLKFNGLAQESGEEAGKNSESAPD